MKNYVDLLYITLSDDFAPLSWAKEFCPSYITNNAVQKNGDYYIRFYFSDEKDIVTFKLIWE